MATGIPHDKRYAGGNMTGAVSAIKKIRGQLSKGHQRATALMAANEETDDAGWYAHKEIHGSKSISKEDWKKGYRMNSKGARVMTKEEQVDEVLGKGATAADYIHDFVNSKNPKFDGKSKKERIRMALGAAYAARNDDADDTDEAYFDGKLRSGPEWGTAKKSQAKVNAIIRGREEDKEMRAYNKAQRLKRNLLKKEEVESVDEESPTSWRYRGSVGSKEYSVAIPGYKDLGNLHSYYHHKDLHSLISKQNPHLEHHEVTAIVNSDGDKNSKQTVEHKGKTYTHHVVNQGRRLVRFHYPEPDLKDDVNYTDSSIDEASKKKALGFKQKGNIFRMKNKTIRKFATSGSRDLHTLLGISQRKRRMGQKINAELEEKEMDVVEPAGPPSVEHQLRKSVSLRGMHPVAFENGETHKVPSHVAQHATSMIQDTPIQHGQREAFIKKLNASPESFYKHIGLEKPQA